jgi:hypothetical protein
VNFPCEMFNDAMYFLEEAKRLNANPQNDWLRWRYLRASLIFSITSLESYVNTFISDITTKTLSLPNVADKLSKKRLDLETKFDCIIPLITKKHIDKNKKEWSDYKIIKKIRKRLVHYTGGTKIYDNSDCGINIPNAEKGITMVRGIIKQLNSLIGQKYPPWVDRKHSWIIR